MEKDILVSVVIVTYNSAEFIIETLNSVKNQTYQNIELIVSDDGSKDNTVEICREWMNQYECRFANCHLVNVEKNTGTSANINRGFKQAKGEWIKGLGGDDRLLPNCIKDNVDFIKQNPNTDLVFSKAYSFSRDGKYTLDYKWNWGGELFKKSTRQEFEIASYYWCLFCSPTVIMSKKCYYEIGGYDESNRLIEDWPMWMKMVNQRKTIRFLDTITAEYRISSSSISQGLGLRNPEYDRCQEMVDKKARDYLRCYSFWARIYFFTRERKEEENYLWSIIHTIQFLNPFYYLNKRVLKKCEDVKKWYKSECEKNNE